MKKFGFPDAIGMTAPSTTLLALPFLPLSQADEPGPQWVAAASTTEKATTPTAAPLKSQPATGEKTKRMVRERLVCEQAARERAAQERSQNTDGETERSQESERSVSILPGPSVETSRDRPPAEDLPVGSPPRIVTRLKPANEEFSISIPRLGIKDILLGDSPAQEYLDREGIMHLTGTGFPYERGSNTYIVGHAGDFDASRIPNAFKNLKDLRSGDSVTLRDSTGNSYDYRIYDRFIVDPTDM